MSSHVAKLAGAVAIGTAVWWLWPRASPPPPAPSIARTPTPGPAATTTTLASPAPGAQPASDPPHAATPRPALPALPVIVPVGPPKLPPEAFAAEPRDDHWARPHEAELHRRAGELGDVQVDGIECRSATCRLSLAGTTGAVSRAIDTLTGAKGLRVPVTLSATAIGSDGATAVTAYVAYPPRLDGADPGD